jgi:hypothetical protein
MTTLTRISITAGCLVGLFVACDKADRNAPPAAEPAAPGGTGPIHYPTTLPGKGTHTVFGRATRGGSGDTRPTASSKHLSEPATDRELRRSAHADGVDCTKPEMDNAAECDGDNLFFCDDKALWTVPCSAETKLAGREGGCYEGDTFTNCLGCGKADDGTDVCCDFQLTVCCLADGNCYQPNH